MNSQIMNAGNAVGGSRLMNAGNAVGGSRLVKDVYYQAASLQ